MNHNNQNYHNLNPQQSSAPPPHDASSAYQQQMYAQWNYYPQFQQAQQQTNYSVSTSYLKKSSGDILILNNFL